MDYIMVDESIAKQAESCGKQPIQMSGKQEPVSYMTKWHDDYVHLVGDNISRTACCDKPSNQGWVTLDPKRVTCPKYKRT